LLQFIVKQNSKYTYKPIVKTIRPRITTKRCEVLGFCFYL